MKVEILDHDVFSAIEPPSLRRYLAANGWQPARDVTDDVMVMAKSISEGQRKLIWVPVNAGFADYESIVSKLVSVVAEVEGKSQLQILDDLQTVGIGDVIRGSTEDVMNRHDHTLPLDEGSRLLDRLRHLAIAGASSAIEKRAVYSPNPYGEVKEFIRNMRLAQTERGSYLMRIICPLEEQKPSPEEAQGQTLLDEQLGSVPFARRAVAEMMRAVKVLREVAEANMNSGRYNFSPFRDSISAGVSANLCEAIIASNKNGTLSPIDISVTWSYIVAGSYDLPTETVRFESEMMPYIQMAGMDFRRNHPITIDVDGWVSLMGRSTRTGPGSIRLQGKIGKRMRSISIDLPADIYRLAVQAHGEDKTIRLTGELVVDGNRYRLTVPRNFHVIEDFDAAKQDELMNDPDDYDN